ncbi:MAG TPA: prolyl oligopeptidase family serine peptidase [Candidatus Baltobacteraceae bacterium]|jgi:prolyl oligopeptidase|nr:prolyl oligopeptidase family serine peptidase [Candidatus Baltobacteraceae bacterium]
MRAFAAAAFALLLLAANPLSYPPAPRGDVTDTYFGTKVADPYRWMENIDSPQTRAWVEAEAALTQTYLSAIPQRESIAAALRNAVNYERFGLPYHAKNHYFYTYNPGLLNQAILYTMDGQNGKPRVLIDPNKLSADGTVALGPTAVSDDGKYFAYSTQSNGSDWQTWRVKSVASGADLADRLEYSRFSGASWLKDDSGFYYSRYPQPPPGEMYKAAALNQTVYFHKIGTPQSSDRLIYSDPKHPDAYVGAQVTEDGRYLIVTENFSNTYNTAVYYEDLQGRPAHIAPLFTKIDAQWYFVDNDGPRFLFETDKGAPNHSIVAANIRNPAVVTTVVPAWSSAIDSVNTVGHNLFVVYLKDAHSAVRQFDYQGRFIREVALPGIGSAGGFSGWRTDKTTYFFYDGYTTPATDFTYDIASGKSRVYRTTHVKLDMSPFVTDEVFYRSKDGTRVPMMIAHRRGIKLDGSNPTILYGYGGFDINLTPYFSVFNATWLRMGGVYAVANMRGGGEYGEAWHHGGMLQNKQNVFDDFIAAAQYLIDQKYTSTPKLAIKGESNGGLLIGAVETQRPELFGAALPGVGVMDMLRFQNFTAGHGWESEYGCSTCSEEQFKTLYAYSPYHNVKDGTRYPPTLISTADHDDRVFPAHSFKFAAAMQHAQAGDAPVLLRVDLNAGHGGGKPLSKSIDDAADQYAFLLKNLNMTLPADF